MRQTRENIRILTIGASVFLSLLIFVRIVFDLIKADRNNSFVKFLLQITDPLINPFIGIFEQQAKPGDFNLNALAAIIFIILIGTILSELLTSFFYDRVSDVMLNLLDFFFKTVETLIIIRLVFDFFKVNLSVSDFADFVAKSTNWAATVINTRLFDGRISLSLVLILLIVMFFDFFLMSIIEDMIHKRRVRRVTVIRQYR